ncbi:MAG: hypothetical protein V4692_04275 [Bdellovibrionota bacterium]
MKKSKVLSVLSITALLVSVVTPSSAERSAGNGGGLGEMKLIYLHQHLGQYLAPCLNPNNPCNLEREERIDFAKALEASRVTKASDLIVDRDLKSDVIFTTERRVGAEVRVSAASLYVPVSNPDFEMQIPNPASQIAAILLAAFWSQVSDKPKSEILDASFRITSQFKDRRVEISLSSDPKLAVHEQRLIFNGVDQLILGLEDSEKTINFSHLLSEKLPCELAETSFETWRFAGSRGDQEHFILADVVSHCAGALSRYHALQLSFSIDEKSLLIEDSLKLKIRDSF